ncbi:MAG: CubicO group peptidase (beta-lactamase class C family) [bacterium]|jgi:CubicO group peptidase (beta-lactamase class C family)
MSDARIVSNPDLTVGEDNKQRWNQVAHRRHGFHNTHHLFRRTLMIRSRNVLMLAPALQELPNNIPEFSELIAHPVFSAFCCLRDGNIIMEAAAPDFSTTTPHSIQSVTKLHIHLIIGRLLEQGLLSLDTRIVEYLPFIGSGYADATVQSLLDMAVTNDFTEDYSDPNSDCYSEEIALGWRLPAEGKDEINLKEFSTSITGYKENVTRVEAEYKSANTDVLTLVSPIPLARHIEEIVDAAGYEGAFHISLSKDGYPAFSGGGCLSARDLARFGLLLLRKEQDMPGQSLANTEFFEQSLSRAAPALSPPKHWLRYSNHLMTDGRFVGHAGYGGQFLLADTKTNTSCAFLSVLLNDSGYDDAYMGKVANALREVCYSLE